LKIQEHLEDLSARG